LSYPANLASDVALRDGSTVTLRPVRPDDAPLLLDLFGGHGFFAAIDDDLVEIAFAVSPALQGQGLGSVLLAQVAERAAEDGFARIVADVLPENHAMISMFRHSGFPVEVRAEPESVLVEMRTSPDPEASRTPGSGRAPRVSARCSRSAAAPGRGWSGPPPSGSSTTGRAGRST
jgi:hypothetical protein